MATGPYNPNGRDKLPGMTTLSFQQSRVFLRDDSHLAVESIRIEKDAEDADNTGKEWKLRAGLVLVRIETGANKGKYVENGHAEEPDTNDIVRAVILHKDENMLDREGARADTYGSGVIHGMVDESKLLWGNADDARKDAIRAVLNLVDFFQPVV